MNEEIMRILKMVEEGKLNADKAKELIDALEQQNEQMIVVKDYDNKMLKVNIESHEGDEVKIKLPVKVIKTIIKATGKLPMMSNNMDGINMDELMDIISNSLDSAVMGEIVNISSAEGDEVKVLVE